MRLMVAFLMLLCCFVPYAFSAKLDVVQIYSDDVLLDIIKENKHLSQMVIDECQLVARY